MDFLGRPSRDGDGPANGAAGVDDRPRYQPLVTVVFALAAGIVLDKYVPAAFGSGQVDAAPAPQWFAAWWFSAATILLAWWLAWRSVSQRVAAWLLLAAVALTGAAWHDFRWNVFSADEVGRFAAFDPQPVAIEAIASESPARVAAPAPTPLRAIPGVERSRLVVEVTGIRDGVNWLPATGACQLLVNGHLLGVHPGDRLQVFGQMARQSPPLNPGEFDFAALARADGRLTRLVSSAPDCVSVLKPDSGWRITSLPELMRRGGERLLKQYVGPQRAGLASAILLGSRDDLPPDEMTAYLVTGTIHVLVVSGTNLTILAFGLYLLMRIGWLPRRTGLAVAIAAIVVYTLVVGAEPSIVRAAALAVVVCVAAWIGRPRVAFNSLALAALIVLFINPGELFHGGTQLSFLAVGVLIWFASWAVGNQKERADRLDELIEATRPWYARVTRVASRWTFWLLMTSLTMWVAALPLVMYQFHVVSPVAVPISLPIWIVVFFVMWSGFLTILFGVVFPPAAPFFGAVCNFSLAGLEGVVNWAEWLPHGHFWSPGPAWWWVAGFYAGLVGVMIYGRALAPPRWQLAALCSWILVGLAPPLIHAMTRDRLECSFVSVGHGACVVLETPSGETLLYDAGSLGSPEYATQMIASYLWHRGITRIDGLVISHADIDHYNAIPGLLERFRIGMVYVSPVMFSEFGAAGESRGPSVLREAIERAGVPIREIWGGDRLRVGPQLTLDVLHPPRQGILGSDNANSITLAVEYEGWKTLLPGDLESPGLEQVMAELPYDCDVLLAPHHGSRRSDPPGFAAWSTPEWVVISGGGSDDVEPVVRTYTRAGANVLDTHRVGAIKFAIQNAKLDVETFH